MELFRPVHVVQRDADVAVALRARNPQALAILLAEHGDAVFAVALDATGDRERATDAAAGTFTNAWERADDVEPGDDFAPWLLDLALEQLGPAGERPRAELAWVVVAALRTLDDEVRELVRLRSEEQLSVDDLAARTGIDDAAVADRLRRADRRIAHHVAPLGHDDEGRVTELLATPTIWAEPPAELFDRVTSAVPIEPGESGGRRRRPRLPPWVRPALIGAAVAVLLLVGGVVVLSALSGTVERDTVEASLVPTGEILDVSGDVTITSFPFGIEVVLDAPSLPPRVDGVFYQAWVGTASGDLVPVGSFERGGQITMTAGVDLDRVTSFVITLETPAPGADDGQASSDDVVLRADLG